MKQITSSKDLMTQQISLLFSFVFSFVLSTKIVNIKEE